VNSMYSFYRSLPKALRLLATTTLLLLIAGVGSVLASNPGVAPVLVPYTMTAIAGNTQSAVPGFGGNGVPGTSATLNAPNALAVDSVGNVYIADQSNALIREVNAQTGIIKIIAGVPPSKCTGTVCGTISPGCADGVPALGNQVGSRMQGLAVDGFGNVYFSDTNYQGVWVIFHGGAQVAKFITLVDAGGVAAAGGVLPGYMYHIAGLATPKAGGGCTGTSGAVDKVLATQGSFHNPLQMGLDGVGNIYVQDVANNVVRVINTQPTTQTFFGVSVQPGFITAVVGCSLTLTSSCPGGTAFGVPATSALYSNAQSGMTTDQFGNVYELNTKGALGSIYAGVAYAGGSSLANLINIESGMTAKPGDWYAVINSLAPSATGLPSAVQAVLANASNNIVLRPYSIAVDPHGNLYMMDTHWISIYRIDVNSQMATRINGLTGATIPAGTRAVPVACLAGATGQSTDAYGDGCPVNQNRFSSGGVGYVTFDGAGNLYVSDSGDNIVRKVSIGTQFPATSVGTSVTQTMQMHFDASNLPATTGTAPNFGTNAFSVSSSSGDFQIAGAPVCSNYTTGLDASIECYVSVTFSPTQPGARTASLKATTLNGSVYPFALTGTGSGPRIAVDGGTAVTLAASRVASAAAVAVDSLGNIYVADPTKNQIVVTVPGGGAQTTVGTGLAAPQGVAVDAAGNVYISDSGNNRIVEVSASTGLQTVLSSNVKSPQGLTLDSNGNLYVADMGNQRILEISPFGELGVAPLLDYAGSQALVSPIGVAVDTAGNIFVADSGNSTGLIKIVAGGGDFQPSAGSANLTPPATVVNFGSAFTTQPGGVAVDAAGNLYVSDTQSNVVQEIPSSTGPGSEPFALNFPGLQGPTGVALDANGSIYVADTGNHRVLFANRTQVAVDFGTVAQFQPPATVALTVSNIGTTPLKPVTPFATVSGATADFASKDTCGASNFPLGTLGAGLHCSLTPSFLPVVNGPLSATEKLQAGAAQVSLIGVGQNPLVSLGLVLTSPPTGPLAGAPAVITATLSQPNGSNIPSGTVTFSYTVNGVTQAAVTQPLVAIGNGKVTATLTTPTLLPARRYVVNATYNGDTLDSVTSATPLTFTAPGVVPLTVVASSASFVYGSPVPTLTGTVTGILPADAAAISISFTSAATPATPVGSYPVTVVLSGGNAQNYLIPNAVTSTGAPAVVTETQAPLSIVVNNVTTPYGATSVSYTDVATGLVNGDKLTATFTPAVSQVLAVGTYTIVPTITSKTKGSTYDKTKNYKVTITNGTLTVTKAASLIVINQPLPAVLPTALAKAAITVAATPQPMFFGTPTGTITLQDVFTPITPTGSGTPVTEPNVTLTLVNGSATYTPVDPTVGTHVYTFTYNGDVDFVGVTNSATPNSLIVDNPDFTVISTTTPIQVVPGVAPGGNPTLNPLEQVAFPEQATVTISPILGSKETVNLTCAVPASYITCTLTPAMVTLTGTATAQTSIVSLSTPLTLPIDFTGQVQRPSNGTVWAFVPLALLTMLPLVAGRRRARLQRLLVLLASVALVLGTSGCGPNLVKFFTPVPAGLQQVTITGTSGTDTRSFVVTVNIQ
jgi:sugar lactone lactonase YvrE